MHVQISDIYKFAYITDYLEVRENTDVLRPIAVMSRNTSMRSLVDSSHALTDAFAHLLLFVVAPPMKSMLVISRVDSQSPTEPSIGSFSMKEAIDCFLLISMSF